MSQPISVDILSDSDSASDDGPPKCHVITTPEPKRQRTEPIPDPSSVVIIEDTPLKHTDHTPDFVSETPGFSSSDVAIVKCTTRFSDPQLRVSEISKLICLESDDESEKGPGAQDLIQSQKSDIVHDVEKDLGINNDKFSAGCDMENDLDLSPRLFMSTFTYGDDKLEKTSITSSHLRSFGDGMTQVNDLSIEENDVGDRSNIERKNKSKATKNVDKDGNRNGRKRLTQEEKNLQMEEKKKLKEEEKLRKEALKAEATELKRLEKEKQKWEKGKLALKSIVAEVDTKIVEVGSIAV